jgi:hypothetical protein
MNQQSNLFSGSLTGLIAQLCDADRRHPELGQVPDYWDWLSQRINVHAFQQAYLALAAVVEAPTKAVQP